MTRKTKQVVCHGIRVGDSGLPEFFHVIGSKVAQYHKPLFRKENVIGSRLWATTLDATKLPYGKPVYKPNALQIRSVFFVVCRSDGTEDTQIGTL